MENLDTFVFWCKKMGRGIKVASGEVIRLKTKCVESDPYQCDNSWSFSFQVGDQLGAFYKGGPVQLSLPHVKMPSRWCPAVQGESNTPLKRYIKNHILIIIIIWYDFLFLSHRRKIM